MSDQPKNPNNNEEWDFSPDTEGNIAIPVRIENEMNQTDEMIDRLKQQERDTARMIEEYEAQYGTAIEYDDELPQDESSHVHYKPYTESEINQLPRRKKRHGWWARLKASWGLPKRHRYPNRKIGEVTTNQEQTWAAIAHASAILTLIAAFTGPPVVLPLLIPLGIYLYWRKKSEYVAFHALQAFTLQVVGTIGFLALLITGVLMLVALIIISAITIIGIPLAIVLAIVLALFVPATFILPLGMVVYGIIAAFATNNGRNYRYPWIADWVDDQLSNGLLGLA